MQFNFKIFLKSFFQKRVSKLSLSVLVFVNLLLVTFVLSFKPKYVFPSEDEYSFTFFTDTVNDGKSEFIETHFTDSVIDVTYCLHEGFIDPYVSISVASKTDSFIDLKYYNRLTIDMEACNTENIGFDIFTAPGMQKQMIQNPVGYYSNILHPFTKRRLYTIDFNKLKVPDYWYVANNMAPDLPLRPDLNKVVSFNIGTAYANNPGIIRSFKIYNLWFDRDNHRFFYWLILVDIMLVLVLLFYFYMRSYKVAQVKQVTINYKPVLEETKMNKSDSESCISYINQNFADPDLSLDKVAKILKISQREVTVSIGKNFGCNFKSYINQLRINEAKRLLKATGFGIGEIAFKVGFNTQSHFNRVFKSMEGVSPTEYRNIDK